MIKTIKYKKVFFVDMQDGSREAASRIIPQVLDIVSPRSVVDVGCGTGEFAAAFSERGIKDILGIDGEYVKGELLAISQEQFLPIDLNQPFELGRTYDLAVCLEVGEHLNPESASGFIASLTRLAPLVLFSAAIPHQVGIHHVNEQWPQYWAELFQLYGYVAVDALRHAIWSDRAIPVWYRQNILFFCKPEVLETNEKLALAYQATHLDALSLVHPDLYLLSNTSTLRVLRRIKASVLQPWRQLQKFLGNLKKDA